MFILHYILLIINIKIKLNVSSHRIEQKLNKSKGGMGGMV